MRALVIGGSGFVGLRVVDALLARGDTVRVTRRKSTPTVLFGRRPLEMAWASLEDRASLVEAMRGCDAALLAGAYYPRYSTDLAGSVAIATRGMRNACDAAHECGVRLVYSSSVAALGPARDGAAADEDDCAPPDPREGVYPTVKKSMERELDDARARGLDAVSLLLGGCIGPRDYRLGTNGLLAALLGGVLPFRIDGWINVLSVDDAAAAHVAALGARGERYCVGGHNVRIDALLSQAAERYGVPYDLPTVDLDEARVRASEAEVEAEARRARVAFPRELVDLVAMGKPVRSERAERDLALRWSDLDAALDATRDWMARVGPAKRAAAADEGRRHHAG